jgi:hypothetical protein
VRRGCANSAIAIAIALMFATCIPASVNALAADCPEAEKILTPIQAIEHAKRAVLNVSSYRSELDWYAVYSSDVYVDMRPIGRLIRGNGWIVGEIKDIRDYYFGVSIHFQDEWRSAAVFAEMDICGHIRDHGFSMDTYRTRRPIPD